MLPEAQHGEAECLQFGCGVSISDLVLLDLPRPELCVGLRCLVMLRAPVPVAAIDEHIEVHPREGDVRTTSTIEREDLADSEPQTRAMQSRPDAEFWLGVPTPIRLHCAPSRGSYGRSVRGVAVGGFCRTHSVAFRGSAGVLSGPERPGNGIIMPVRRCQPEWCARLTLTSPRRPLD
jgi:hypothetical protein